jgi:hypothetical protein
MANALKAANEANKTATRQPNVYLTSKRIWRLRCPARFPTTDKATRDSDITHRGYATSTSTRRGRNPQSGRAGGGYPAHTSTRPGGTLGKGPRCVRISGRSGISTSRHGAACERSSKIRGGGRVHELDVAGVSKREILNSDGARNAKNRAGRVGCRSARSRAKKTPRWEFERLPSHLALAFARQATREASSGAAP